VLPPSFGLFPLLLSSNRSGNRCPQFGSGTLA
jgi:hypothetical protein